MSQTEEILKSLEPLFEQATRENKWFFCSYQALDFSPKELREAHKQGRFIWGPVNWKLIDPPKLKSVEEEIKKVHEYNDELRKRLER